MTIPSLRRSAPRAALAALVLLLAACSKAPTYEFTATTQDITTGAGFVEVGLKKMSTGNTVENAVIVATRIDMAPDGMQQMASTVVPQGMSSPGVFRFGVNLGMAGKWELHLSAKVPDKAEPVEGSVIFTVK